MNNIVAGLLERIVNIALEAAGDIDYAASNPAIKPERADSLKALAKKIRSTVEKAKKGDYKAIRSLCVLFGLEELLNEFDREIEKEKAKRQRAVRDRDDDPSM